MRPRHAVLLIPPKSSHPSQFRSRQLSAPVTSLAATLMNLPASVANKRLAAGLTSLDATLTKKRGGGPCSEVRACQRCNAPFVHSFRSLRKECFTTPFDSQGSTLFLKTAGCTPTLPFLELPTRRSPPYSTHFFSIASALLAKNTRGGGGSFLLTNRLLAPGRYSNGFIHVSVCLLARLALALITAFKVLKIMLKNSRANLAQPSLAGVLQCGLGFFLGDFVRMFTELLDGVKGAPVSAVLALALSRDLLLQGVNQEIVGPQYEHEPRDPKNHEPLEHGVEPTASAKFILADCSLRRAA